MYLSSKKAIPKTPNNEVATGVNPGLSVKILTQHGFLQTIYEGIRTNQGEDIKWDYNVRAHFYHYFRKYDQMRGTNFLETFPEYENFYDLCRSE